MGRSREREATEIFSAARNKMGLVGRISSAAIGPDTAMNLMERRNGVDGTQSDGEPFVEQPSPFDLPAPTTIEQSGEPKPQ
jgi:hypothetical protein